MRPRTPSILWLPFVFSIGTLSWVLLVGSLLILAAVVIVPAYQQVCEAKNTRYDIQATLDLLDQKIAIQKEFIEAANKEPVLMKRLASRQLNQYDKNQEFLDLGPKASIKDGSVDTLLAESLTPVTPEKAEKVPYPLEMLGNPTMRTSLVLIACVAMAVSFFLGVKYERR